MDSESIDALEATMGDLMDDHVEFGDSIFDSSESIAVDFEDLKPTRPTVSATVSSAAKTGKRTAGTVARGTAVGSSSGSLSSARSVARSVSGYASSLNPNELKMAALTAAIGGLGAGYANRRRKRR